MRLFLLGIFITFFIAASQNNHIDASDLAPAPPDFASLEPFARGVAMSNREVTIYKLRAANLPTHRYQKPIAIVWTNEATVVEQKDDAPSVDREVSAGQIDVYPSGTVHSLRAVKGLLRFTLIELKQSLRDPEGFPKKLAYCESVVEFPEGGFSCLIRLASDQQITIPQLDVNSFSIAIDPGMVRYTVPRHHWDASSREGQPSYLPGYEEHAVQNLERKSLRFVLIVPPPAEYD